MVNRSASDWSGHIYLFQLEGTNFYKVGLSRDVKRRLKAVNAHSPMTVNLVESIRVELTGPAERFIHNRLRQYHVKSEWFDLPSTQPWKDAVEALLATSFARRIEARPVGRPILYTDLPNNTGPSDLASTLGVSRQRAWQLLKREQAKANRKLLRDLKVKGLI